MAKEFYIFFGPPGSGKGTQAEFLEKKLKLPVISTGVLLRREIENMTELGKRVEEVMARGDLVPDDIVVEMIKNRIEKDDAEKGAILDGYPRTMNQQKILLDVLEKIPGAKITNLLVDVSDEEVIRRIAGRRSCVCGLAYHMIYNPPKQDETCDYCGAKLMVRPDDSPETSKARLKVYHSNVDPIIDYWKKQGKLIVINGELPIKEVAKEISKKLEL